MLNTRGVCDVNHINHILKSYKESARRRAGRALVGCTGQAVEQLLVARDGHPRAARAHAVAVHLQQVGRADILPERGALARAEQVQPVVAPPLRDEEQGARACTSTSISTRVPARTLANPIAR